MKTDEQQKIIRLELKYCERCGGLWLRPAASPDVYCPRCIIAMQPMAPPTRQKNKARIPGPDHGEGHGPGHGVDHATDHGAGPCHEQLSEAVQKDSGAWARTFRAGGAA